MLRSRRNPVRASANSFSRPRQEARRDSAEEPILPAGIAGVRRSHPAISPPNRFGACAARVWVNIMAGMAEDRKFEPTALGCALLELYRSGPPARDFP